MLPIRRAIFCGFLCVAVAGCGGDDRGPTAPSNPPPPSGPAPPTPPAPPPAGTRATTDRPDEITGHHVKIMYVVPSDGVDDQLDTNGTLVTSVEAFNRWLERESGGQRLRMDTYQGSLDIGFMRLSESDSQIASTGVFVRDRIQSLLRAQGFTVARKLYAVYYGGSSTASCGGGAWPPVLVGSVAALYLRGLPPGAPPCITNPFTASPDRPGYLEFAMLHEVLHTVGIVGSCAPNHTLSGHVADDPRDLMYAGPQPWIPSILDARRDDYFAHGRGCLDLSKLTFMQPTAADAVAPPGW
jgi:hypothetical protein